MSKTEGFEILNSQNGASIVDRLVDISDLPEKHCSLTEDKKSQSTTTTTKEYIEKLQKEKMALWKMMLQRNNIIEQSGTELQKLRLNLIKAQEQNQKLAKSHTQMIAELNSGKDRLKALHHVLGCKNGLLKARNLEFKVNSNKSRKEDKSPTDGRDEENPRNAKRKIRSKSLGPFETSQSEENAGKRPSTGRRSSARNKALKPKEADDLFEADDMEFSECRSLDEPVSDNGSNSMLVSVKNEDYIREARESRRSSLCRPSRMVAKKVQSYKEIPLNIKMRRSE